MIGKERCPCGHRSCDKWFLTGIGSFVQGSGFTEDEADEIIAALQERKARPKLTEGSMGFRCGCDSRRSNLRHVCGKHGPACFIQIGPVEWRCAACVAAEALTALGKPIAVSDAMIRAATESRARDDEGEFAPLYDLLGFDGSENKTRTVVRAALEAALAKVTE